MKVSFDPNLLNELIDQSHNPPGQDIILGNFYACLVEMVENQQEIARILMKVKEARPEITYKHLVNLIFRTYQAIKFKKNDLSHQSYNSIGKWREEFESILSEKEVRYDFERLLLTKSTTSTIYQRYAGPFVIIAHLWDGQDVSIADLGCGGNYGLRGIELKKPFKKIKDLTPKKWVLKMLNKKVHLKKGLAIDKENPDEESVKYWRLACSFYPREFDEMNAILDFEEIIKQSTKVKFIQTDLLTTKTLPKLNADVVILSTVLYQLKLADQLALIEKAKKMLKRGGIIIVQDFAVKSKTTPKHLDFSESWFGKNYSYRTFILGTRTRWKFLEILQWNNGRCKSVSAGEDFAQLNASKAALAHSTS